MKKKIIISVLIIVLFAIVLNIFNFYGAHFSGNGLDSISHVNLKFSVSIIAPILAILVIYYELFNNKERNKKWQVTIKKWLLIISGLIAIFTPVIEFIAIGTGTINERHEVYNIFGFNAYKLLTNDSASWWLVGTLLTIILIGFVFSVIDVVNRFENYYITNFSKKSAKTEKQAKK